MAKNKNFKSFYAKFLSIKSISRYFKRKLNKTNVFKQKQKIKRDFFKIKSLRKPFKRELTNLLKRLKRKQKK